MHNWQATKESVPILQVSGIQYQKINIHIEGILVWNIPGIYLDVKLKILRYNKCLATGMRREAVQDERNRGSGGGGGGANNSGGGGQVVLKVI